jgi:hypothetical protein
LSVVLHRSKIRGALRDGKLCGFRREEVKRGGEKTAE